MNAIRPSRLVSLAVFALAASCAEGRPTDARVATEVSSELVGASGASLTGPAGAAVVVPAGALTDDTTIVVSALAGVRAPAGTAVVGEAMRLEPAGTTFSKPVEVTIPISPTSLNGASVDDVVVVRSEQNSNVFVPLPTRRSGNGMAVVAVTEHFSDFVPVVIVGTARPFGSCGDAMCIGGETCDSCPADCGVCVAANICGNGTCEPNAQEACSTCPFDCGTCTTGVCGDGVIDLGETCDGAFAAGTPIERCLCDDANPCTTDSVLNGSPGNCDVACLHVPMTGYGLSDCDDGIPCTFDVITAVNPTICQLTCSNVPLDDVAYGAIHCDDSDPCTVDVANGYVPATCYVESCYNMTIPGCIPVCGDGYVTGSEVCDDYNTVSADGCTSDCLVVESGYTCPMPPVGGPCWQCGNGFVEPGEACDEGTFADGVGCEMNCTNIAMDYDCQGVGEPCAYAPPCGNRRIDVGETCDDGNGVANDGCDATCNVESGYSCPILGVACYLGACGNSTIEGPEQCDDGNSSPWDGCPSDCLNVEYGWTCVGASMSSCSHTCGDLQVAMGAETCDDGGFMPGDGCDTACQAEAGYTCPAPVGGMCMLLPICGDGFVTGGETCDDSNTMPTDGCDGNCAAESGWSCPGTGGSCLEVCGDGLQVGSEACDAGAGNGTYNGPCDNTCTGLGPYCGDGIPNGPEVCDDGIVGGGPCLMDDCSG